MLKQDVIRLATETTIKKKKKKTSSSVAVNQPAPYYKDELVLFNKDMCWGDVEGGSGLMTHQS